MRFAISLHDVIKEWLADRGQNGKSAVYVDNLSDLKSVSADPKLDYLLGLFSHSDMPFADDEPDYTKIPRLVDMVESAINVLKTNENGFYLFAEG